MLNEKTRRVIPNQAYVGKRVLITGATGFIGSSLVRHLSGSDCEITRLSRTDNLSAPPNGAARIIDCVGDIQESDVWREAIQNVDLVFHLASQTSVYAAEEDPRADWRYNVLPMLRLLEACKCSENTLGVVFAGTSTQVGLPESLPVDETSLDHPVTIYDMHKLQAERYLMYYTKQGLVNGMSLRLCNVYGPGPASSSADRGVLNVMIRRAVKGDALTVYGEGQNVRDYIFVDDVVKALVTAGRNDSDLSGHHFFIGSGVGHTIRDAFQTIAQRVKVLVGVDVAVERVQSPPGLSPIEARDFVADVGLFSGRTGWKPGIGLAEGIDRTARWVLQQDTRSCSSAAGAGASSV